MLVLFVDDDLEDFELFDEAAKEADSSVKCLYSSDGEKAIKTLTTLVDLPDIIFLDINMPIMGGKECLINIKDNPKLKDIPVVMYSTTSHQKEIDTYKTLGAYHFLVKPPNFKTLVKSLRELFTA